MADFKILNYLFYVVKTLLFISSILDSHHEYFFVISYFEAVAFTL